MNYFNESKYFGTKIGFWSVCKLHFLVADLDPRNSFLIVMSTT